MSVTLLYGAGPAPAGPGVRPTPAVGDVVALTPSALQACARAGVEAIVVDDVIDTVATFADRREYVAWQLDWFARVDRAVGAHGALRAAALYLLIPVDSVVVSARRLRALLTALGPGAVTYAGPRPGRPDDPLHAGHVQFWPRLGDTPLAAQLLPLLGRDLGVEVSMTMGRADPPLSAPATSAHRGGLRRRAGPVIRQLQVLWPPVVRARGKTLLLWSSGYGAAGFAAEERRGGHRTYVLERGHPATSIRGPALRAVGPRVDTQTRTGHDDGPELDALLGEVDAWAGLAGAGALLATRAAALAGLARVIDRAAGGLQPQLERLGIERVAAANPFTVEEFAALLAASRAGARRLLLQHGDHLFPYDSWLVSETQNFDELWVSDATVADDLARAASAYGAAPPEFRLRSPRVDALRKARAAPPVEAERPTVAYVPSVLLGDSWLFGDGRFDDAWYHRWHLRLLDLMASRPEIDFVWKAYPAADQSVDPIPEEIGRRGVANVRYETGPLVPQLQRAHRVITDFPSTPLYEAVHLGRPVLALTFRRFAELRPSAGELFAPVLRPCDTEEEALAAIGSFLDDPADRWLLPSEHVLPT